MSMVVTNPSPSSSSSSAAAAAASPSASRNSRQQQKKRVRMSVDFGRNASPASSASSSARDANRRLSYQPGPTAVLYTNRFGEVEEDDNSGGGVRFGNDNSVATHRPARPTVVVSAPGGVSDDNGNGSGRYEFFNLSEVDPKIVLTASMFVEDLLGQAQQEADRRLESNEMEPLLGGVSGEESRSVHIDFTLPSSAGSGSGRQHHSGRRDSANINFIRQEINKKCRRIYHAFLSCYGRMP